MVGTPKIDFLIPDSNDPKYLIVADVSEYFYIADKPAIVEIILPGFQRPVTHYISKGANNIFNSINLFLNCPTGDCFDQEYLDLPDGIYQITLKASPDSFRKGKYYLKTDILMLDFYEIHVQRGIENTLYDETFLKWSAKVRATITSAKGAAIQGLLSEASRHYKEAVKMVEQYKECKNCY